MGDTGFEPVTSTVSRKRATTAPIARVLSCGGVEVGTGFEPVYTDLQSVASPLGQPTVEAVDLDPASLRADDEARTRDLNLGKVALYQLSYVRLQPPVSLRCEGNHSRSADWHKLGASLARRTPRNPRPLGLISDACTRG